jgi:outer membrane receptor protein involved in Fe transport
MLGITQGINDDVESSIVTNARAAYQLERTKIFLHINNLFNQSYFIIERRPIPGRHFRIGIQLKLF